jgi:hypothetical protein
MHHREPVAALAEGAVSPAGNGVASGRAGAIRRDTTWTENGRRATIVAAVSSSRGIAGWFAEAATHALAESLRGVNATPKQRGGSARSCVTEALNGAVRIGRA